MTGFGYSNHQVPRGARADAENYDKFFLLKIVSTSRLTYQIRLLTFHALESKKTLVIQVPKQCKIHASLREFTREFEPVVRVEKV